jgi:uncharacterized protein RhaS with RHS repeats
MRIYDPRLGRFLSVDPITSDYPELTPYQFASNTPIWAIDMDGLEAYYSNPTQVFYQGAADLTAGLANAWDRVTGFFFSHKTEVDIEKTKSTSLLTTNETTVDVGGNMQSYIRAGRYSSTNTMPKLKVSDVYDIKIKSETKVELKTKVEAGNVKIESKVNLSNGSTEVKGTVKLPKVGTRVPLKVAGSVANDNTNNSTKVKVEVKTDTKPIDVGVGVEVTTSKNGAVSGKASVTGSYEKKVGKVTTKNTLSVGKKF